MHLGRFYLALHSSSTLDAKNQLQKLWQMYTVVSVSETTYLKDKIVYKPTLPIYSFLISWWCAVEWPWVQRFLWKPLSINSFSIGTVSSEPRKKWYSISLGLIVLRAASDNSILPYLTGTSGLLDLEYSDSITWAWSCSFSMWVTDLKCLSSER